MYWERNHVARKRYKADEKDVHRRNRAWKNCVPRGRGRLPREACRHPPRVAEPVPAKTVINCWNFKVSQSLLAGCTLKTYHQGELDSKFPLQSTKSLSTLQASGVPFQICLGLQELRNKPLGGLKQH